MRLNVNKKDLVKLYENQKYDALIKIIKVCTDNETLISDFSKRIKSNNKKDAFDSLFQLINMVRSYNIFDDYNNFIPYNEKKKNTFRRLKKEDLTIEEIRYLKNNKKDINEFKKTNKDCINKQSFETLKEIYEISKEDCYIGIHRTNYFVDEIFQEGIKYGSYADLDDMVQRMHNFDFMISEISRCENYKNSFGCFIIKIPKNAIEEKNEAIYYEKENSIFLNPKYVVAHVDVKNKKIINVELNEEMDLVNSTIFEGESINIDSGKFRNYF